MKIGASFDIRKLKEHFSFCDLLREYGDSETPLSRCLYAIRLILTGAGCGTPAIFSQCMPIKITLRRVWD